MEFLLMIFGFSTAFIALILMLIPNKSPHIRRPHNLGLWDDKAIFSESSDNNTFTQPTYRHASNNTYDNDYLYNQRCPAKPIDESTEENDEDSFNSTLFDDDFLIPVSPIDDGTDYITQAILRGDDW